MTRRRLMPVLRKYAIILGVGVAYLILVLWLGWGIPCPFYTLTGWKCPACGISRMLMALARLDLLEAFRQNAMLLCTLPLLLFCLIYPDVRYVLWGRRGMGRLWLLPWIEIGLLLLFGIFRNLVAVPI